MKRIREWWDLLTPEKKKMTSAGGVFLGLLAVLYVFVSATPEDKDRRSTKNRAPERNLLTGSDPRSLGLDALGNDLRANEASIKTLRGALQQKAQRDEQREKETAQRIKRIDNQIDLMREELSKQLGGFTQTQNNALENLRKEVRKRKRKDGTEIPLDEPKPGTLSTSEIVEQDLFDHPSLKPAVEATGPDAATGATGAAIKVRVFGEEEIESPARAKPSHTVTLTSGAIMSGLLINGVDAPTGNRSKRDPMPALVRIKHDAILPNRYRSDIRECFIIVATTGDLSTERVFMRGESLSCVRNDKRIIEIDIDAYAVGEDGKVGMRGRLVHRSGALVAKAAAAAFAESLSNIFRPVRVQAFNTSPTSDQLFQAPDAGEALEASGFAGASGALSSLADFYMDLADQIVPFIEVDAGRRIDMILLEGATLTIREGEKN